MFNFYYHCILWDSSMAHHQFNNFWKEGHSAPKQNAKYLLDHKEHTTSLYSAIIYSRCLISIITVFYGILQRYIISLITFVGRHWLTQYTLYNIHFSLNNTPHLKSIAQLKEHTTTLYFLCEFLLYAPSVLHWFLHWHLTQFNRSEKTDQVIQGRL